MRIEYRLGPYSFVQILCFSTNVECAALSYMLLMNNQIAGLVLFLSHIYKFFCLILKLLKVAFVSSLE